MVRIQTASAAPLLLAFASLLSWGQATSGTKPPKLGAVASEAGICSRIGTRLLEDGGNAADALVGTVFCIGTVAMYHSGIGGGGFMLVRTSNATYEFVDCRETAPAAAFQDMYKNNTQASTLGGLASGVPGELRGTEYIHKKYGKLKWADVIAPSIKLARHGFAVTQDLVNYMKSVTPNNKFFTENPTWAIDFAPNGRLLQVGEIMTRKRYADTLEAIAENGVEAFYSGPIARAMIAALQKANGTMKMEDLKNYTVAHRDTVRINYRGYTLTSTDAPSGGVVSLSALNTVSGYDGFGDPAQINLTTHRLDEAIRWAYGQRTELGDPLFVDGMAQYTKNMISAETGAAIRSKISDIRTQDVSYYDPKGLESKETPGTSHIVSADASGFAISMTTTVNLLFGSQVMVPETGVIMNNQMGDFSIPGVSNSFGYVPSPANFVRPGKRPLSSMSPIIVEKDGKLYLAVGSAGGSRIITATIQNVHHVLDQNMTIAEALAEPRLHDQLSPNVVSFEYAYDNSTVAYMKALGHNVTWIAPGQSTAQGLRMLPDGTFEAAGEPRQFASGGYARQAGRKSALFLHWKVINKPAHLGTARRLPIIPNGDYRNMLPGGVRSGGRPDASFVSFSIELSSFPDFAGNKSHPNEFSYNLLNNLGQLSGTKPFVRVGGNTQDYALYNASLQVGLNGTVDPARSPDYPTTIQIGPAFFESYQTWPGVRFSHGFNLGQGGNNSAGWQTLLDTVPLACKAIGRDNFYTWEYGNEPNNYATSAQGPVRPKSWDAPAFTKQWLNGSEAIRAQIRKHCPELAHGDYLRFMAPSYDDRVSNLNATVAWREGLDGHGSVRWYSVHNYIDGATSPGVTLQRTLMNHTRTTRDVDEQVAEYKRIMSVNDHHAPLIFGETNSLYNQGKPGLSNSFGATLWGVDFNLYSASAGFKRVHMHQGTNYRYQAWQPIDTDKTAKGTKAPYYGSIAVAATLGDLARSAVSVSSIPMSSDAEAAYAIYDNGSLQKLMVINMHGYNTTKDGAGVDPLPSAAPRPKRSFSFAVKGLRRDAPVRVQRLMANGSDAITGVTFDGWSYNMELDNGRPVKMHNVTTGEVVKASRGVVTVQVPDSSAALLHLA
ncbi:gamma-glutamyltranspeptidase [Purpureocillium lavendulum]|uniref:Glutathione hydrolase n=1 Tax=Purpureocillium lavendulum TaxID=1247861 RepID=A0AB34FP89_9HYPO|nr:gamma-glutamyltranspeptidase [Purpureocillium lavendulum]